MAVSRCIVVLLMVSCAALAAQVSPQVQAANKPTLVGIAKQVLADREGVVATERQAVEQDSYLEALEYSHNSAALQGESGGLSGFFRLVQFHTLFIRHQFLACLLFF